jgi:type I restriction enzyme, S subunit
MSSNVALSDVLEIRKRAIDPREHPDSTFFYYSMPAFDESGEPQVVTGGSIDSGKFRVDPGDILISKLNPRIKRVWKVDNDGSLPSICSTEFVDVVPRNPEDRDFVFHLLGSESVYRELRRVAEGTTNSHVRFRPGFLEQISTRGLPIRDSWSRIAEILSTVDEAIEHTEALIAKTQQIKTGLMHDLFTRGVTPDGRLRPQRDQAPELYKQSPLGWIPREWEAMCLGDAAADMRYGTSAPSQDEPIGIPVLRIPNIVPGTLDLSDLKFQEPSPEDLKRFTAIPGDILVVRTNGNPSILGTCAVVGEDVGTVLFASYLIRIRTDRRILLPRFVSEFFQTRPARSFIESRAATSAGNFNINTTSLRVMPIPRIELNEQDQILCRVNHFETNAKFATEALKKLETFKVGLMMRLFGC